MLKKDLAEALGISGAMVSKLAARGMPTHSIGAARLWRSAHLSQGHTKAFRAPPVPRSPDPVAVAEALNVKLRDNLGAPPVDRQRIAEELQRAMRAIPASRRHELALFLGCWGALMGRLPELVECSDDEWLSDDHPWFEIAAGLVPMPEDLA